MSVGCYGVRKHACGTSNHCEERIKRRNIVKSVEENYALKSAFHGFEKLPLVLIPRIDITPYLKKHRYQNSRALVKSELSNESALHLAKLSLKCAVVLPREDFSKFRGRVNSSPVSDSSKDSDSMVNLKCKICEKVYSSEKKLQNHQENKHMIVYKPQNGKKPKRVSFSDHVIVHEVQEYHRCRKCTKIFEDYKSLKAHMKQVHKKRKCYICNYCNKSFMDRIFFKVHIKLHCDVCGLLSPNRAKYLVHRRDVCRVFKLHKCRTCDESFFNLMDLKDHSYEHISTYFICDVCKDQFATKCAVSHHISFLHSNKRPESLYSMRNLGTERLYLCNFCEESSVDRDILEKHVELLPDLNNRVMTGYKDYYFCDHCLRKFDTETDMLQHKWTHFLKTSDNSQTRPNGVLSDEKSEIKKTFKADDMIPDYMQPKVVLERVNVNEEVQNVSEDAYVDEENSVAGSGKRNKALVDPKSKKTIVSNYQCQTCGKYYSSNYALNRHRDTQHSNYQDLQCKVCEETFVWPSLLQSHKCIRMKIPEMPFDDARPEIHFDNLHELSQNGFDDFNITENDDYLNTVDFDIPEPIVELTECENAPGNIGNGRISPLHNLGYKVVMQEVPIEF